MNDYNRNLKIIKGIKAGNERSLNRCIKTYKSYVAYIVGNIIGSSLSQEDKEEVISDVFIVLWKKCNLIDEKQSDKFKAYIGTIARNLSKNKLRERKNIILQTDLDENFADELNLENFLINKEQQEDLFKCILQLKKIDQICFLKYYYYQKNIKEIALELNLSESAVKSKLYRGRDKIKMILSQEEDNA